jgi:predicted transcriptional regulator
MDTASHPGDPTQTPEIEADRQRRLAWEAARIAEARAELDAGLYVDSAEIGAWLHSIGTANPLPPPPTRRR